MKRYVKEFAKDHCDFDVWGLNPESIAIGKKAKQEMIAKCDRIVNRYEKGLLTGDEAIMCILDVNYYDEVDAIKKNEN